MAKNANAITFFCNDIREEKSGQVSLIGVFDDVVRVESLPTIVPKIAIMAMLSVSTSEEFNLQTVRVFFEDGETLVSEEIPDDVRQAEKDAIRKALNATPPQDWATMRVVVHMANVKVPQGGRLFVEFVSVAGISARSNSLRFVQSDPTTHTHSVAVSTDAT